MIARAPDLKVVACVSSGDEALEVVATGRPNIALVDVGLKAESSTELIRRMRRMRPGFPVLVMTVRDHEQYAERAARAGARGYVCKTCSAEALADAIRRVLAGRFHPPNAETAGRGDPPVPSSPETERLLTERESEVLRSAGLTSDAEEIAEQLGLSPKTVEVYFYNIRRKLQLGSMLDLYRLADTRYGGAAAAGDQGPPEATQAT